MLVSIYDTCRGHVRYAYDVGRSETARKKRWECLQELSVSFLDG